MTRWFLLGLLAAWIVAALVLYAFLVPIFFVSIGLVTDFAQLRASALPYAGVLIVASVLTKVVGTGAGALLGGVTLVPSHGFRTLKERTRKLELPHFVNLSTILKHVDDTTQRLMSVVDDHLVDALIQTTRSVIREPLTPNTGIGFVIDVDRVFGMDV